MILWYPKDADFDPLIAWTWLTALMGSWNPFGFWYASREKASASLLNLKVITDWIGKQALVAAPTHWAVGGSCMFSVPWWSSPSTASSRAVARPWNPAQRLSWRRGDEPQALSPRRDHLKMVCLVMWPAGGWSWTVSRTADWNHNLEDQAACTTSPTEENHYRWEDLERAVTGVFWLIRE